MKHLGINLTKYIWDLYEENYTILPNKIKELESSQDGRVGRP